MSSILLHICCAPCSISVIKALKSEKHELKGLYYNPNIHPSREYVRRRETLKNYAELICLDVICPAYDMEVFFNRIKDYGQNRCRPCYEMRLEKTAQEAKRQGFKTFTTTLLYSKRQKHEIIKEVGNSIARKHGLNFYYKDFRDGWQDGIEESNRLGLYRQNYCGCIFSEKERFYK